MLGRGNQRGDTIIEVLFAVTVFSLVAVGGLSIMNQGTAMAQRALEIGLVRQQIDTQIDGLRFLNQAYIADYGKHGDATKRWQEVIAASAVSQAQLFSDVVADGKCQLPSTSGNAFALDVQKLGSNPKIIPSATTATYAQVRHEQDPARAEGIWIQAVKSVTEADASKPGFYDFHVRACWDSPGQNTPMTIGTIVRLYEPRG